MTQDRESGAMTSGVGNGPSSHSRGLTFPGSALEERFGFSLAYSSSGSFGLAYGSSSVSTFFKLKDNLLLKIAQFLFFLLGRQSGSFIFLIAEIFLFD